MNAFQVIRLEPRKMSNLAGMQAHNDRLYQRHSNPDINTSKSHENEFIVPCKNIRDKVMDVVNAQKRKVRTDANVVAEFVITASPDAINAWDRAKQDKYFEASVAWLQNRYGKENVLHAVVHRDETTPHLHVSLVPMSQGRLCYKDLFSGRKLLQDLQTDFNNDVSKAFGLERGEPSDRKHLSVEEYKEHLLELQKESMTLDPKEVRKQAYKSAIKGDEMEILKRPNEAIKTAINAIDNVVLRERRLDTKENALVEREQRLQEREEHVEAIRVGLEAEIERRTSKAIQERDKAFKERDKAIQERDSIVEELKKRMIKALAFINKYAPSLVEQVQEMLSKPSKEKPAKSVSKGFER